MSDVSEDPDVAGDRDASGREHEAGRGGTQCERLPHGATPFRRFWRRSHDHSPADRESHQADGDDGHNAPADPRPTWRRDPDRFAPGDALPR